jgi:hypothetical protein
MMRLNVQKIDQRIKKLQELRRLAADPEIASMLLEFIGPEEQEGASAQAVNGAGSEPAARPDATAELIQDALAADAQPGGSIWGIRRR